MRSTRTPRMTRSSTPVARCRPTRSGRDPLIPSPLARKHERTQRSLQMNDANDMSSGEEAGKAAGKRTPEGRRFSGEYAREMGRRGAQKRLAKAAGAADADADSILVTV